MRNLWILTRFLLKRTGKSNQRGGKRKHFSDGGRIVVYLLLECLPPSRVGLTVSSGIFRLYLPAAAPGWKPC